MINIRKRILFALLGGIVSLLAGNPSNSYAQKPIDFTGTWQTILMMNGKSTITLTIVQNGDQVVGSYAGNGKIEGTVSGKVLRFTWQSDKGSGSGRFVMDEKERASPAPGTKARIPTTWTQHGAGCAS